MLLTFTEAQSKNSVAINPTHIVSVFTIEKADNDNMKEFVGKAAIVLINGNVIVEEDYLSVVGMINGALANG
ncbi:MAG: hypothetical protein EBU90_16615 [Proteobacteria bacterium]|nr:hypothetical protein [Pseudomonadota bacterium]